MNFFSLKMFNKYLCSLLGYFEQAVELISDSWQSDLLKHTLLRLC